MSANARYLPTDLLRAMPLVAACTVTALTSALVARGAIDPRLMVAGFLSLALVSISIRSPVATVMAAVVLLALLGMVRRLLSLSVPSGRYDPLLVVGPVSAVALLLRYYVVEPRRLAPDAHAKLTFALVSLSLVEVMNPGGQSITANVTGLLFVGAPMMWYFVGRALPVRAAQQVIYVALATSSGIALYGLWQSTVGLPPWDAKWADDAVAGGYVALQVGGSVRSFGTLGSSAEYASLLAIGMVTATALIARRSAFGLLLLPLLAYAIFIDGSRGIVILAAIASVAVFAVSRWRGRGTGVAFATGVVALLSAQQVLAHTIDESIQPSNPLVAHQLQGLAHPVDPETSTAGLHVAEIANAVQYSLRHPLGSGPGAANIATTQAGGVVEATGEFDAADSFVNGGFVTGPLYLGIIATTLVMAVRASGRRRDLFSVVVVGVLIATLGHWLDGGYYAVSTLVWLLIGAMVGTDHRTAATTTSDGVTSVDSVGER